MSEVQMRRLNDAGFAAFADWLAEGAPGEPLGGWLSDDQFTMSCDEEWTIDPDLMFANRFELGAYIWSRVGPTWNTEFENDVGFWSWICLLYFSQVRPAQKLRVNDNYIYDPHRYSFYRHCIAMPTKLVRDLGDDAKVFLSPDITVMGDMLEQCMSRQYLMRSKTFLGVVRKLYYNEAIDRLKPGASSEPQKKKTAKGAWSQSGAGSVRRLATEVRRLELAFNLEAMTPDQMLLLLGGEYARFKSSVAPA